MLHSSTAGPPGRSSPVDVLPVVPSGSSVVEPGSEVSASDPSLESVVTLPDVLLPKSSPVVGGALKVPLLPDAPELQARRRAAAGRAREVESKVRGLRNIIPPRDRGR